MRNQQNQADRNQFSSNWTGSESTSWTMRRRIMAILRASCMVLGIKRRRLGIGSLASRGTNARMLDSALLTGLPGTEGVGHPLLADAFRLQAGLPRAASATGQWLLAFASVSAIAASAFAIPDMAQAKPGIYINDGTDSGCIITQDGAPAGKYSVSSTDTQVTIYNPGSGETKCVPTDKATQTDRVLFYGPASATGSTSVTIGGDAYVNSGNVGIGGGQTGTPANSMRVGSVATLGVTTSGTRSIAIGEDTVATTASGTDSVAIGNRAIASNTNATAIGYQASASGTGAFAGGGNATAGASAGATDSVALGGQSSVASGGTSGIAIGKGATVLAAANQGTAIGTGAKASASGATALGGNATAGAQAIAADSVAIGGQSSVATAATSGIAIGKSAAASVGTNTIAVGNSAAASGTSATAIGDTAKASGFSNTALGSGANASGTASATALGQGATASGDGTTAVGVIAKAIGTSATAVGVNSTAGGVSAVAMGDTAKASGDAGVAIGLAANATSTRAIAIGNGASAQQYSVAIGDQAGINPGATIVGGQTAVGNNAGQNVTGNTNTAYGASAGSNVTGNSNVALGSSAGDNVTQTAASAAGSNNNGLGEQNTAVGANAGSNVDGDGNAAFGTGGVGSQLTGNGNVSLGGAAALGSKGSFNLISGQNAGQFIQGDNNLISGTGAGGQTKGANNISLGSGAGIVMKGDSNIAMGSAAGQNVTASNTVSLGTSAKASADNAIAIGLNSVASVKDTIALGNGAKATGTNAIAIGTGAVATGSTAFGVLALAGNGGAAFGDFADAGGVPLLSANPASVAGVAIGSNAKNTAAQSGTALGERASSTASYGVALGATSVAGVAGGAAGYNPANASVADKAAITATNSTTLGAVSVGTGAAGGNRQIVNVAAGTNASDAVNVAQLVAAQNAATTHYYSVNSTNQATGSNYANDGATGTNALAAGVSASATSTNSVAMGNGAQATDIGGSGVAIGDGSVASGVSGGTVAIGRNNKAASSGIVQGITDRISGGSYTLPIGGTSILAASVAIGDNNDVTGAAGGVALGDSNVISTSGTAGFAFGNANKVSAPYGLATGFGNLVTANSGIAIGTANTVTNGLGAIAIGRQNTASAGGTVALGYVSTANNVNAIAIGNSTQSTGAGAIAIGGGTAPSITNLDPTATKASGNDSVAMGTSALSAGARDVSVGFKAGLGSKATNANNTSVGAGSGNAVDGQDNTAIGDGAGSSVTGNLNLASGSAAGQTVRGSFNIASGVLAGNTLTGSGNIALGAGANSSANVDVLATTFSAGTAVTANNTVAIGTNSLASKDDAIALGNGATASGASAISIGKGNVVSGSNSGAIGDPSFITGAGTYTIGNNNGTTVAPIAAGEAGAFGNNNLMSAAATGSRIIGNGNDLDVADAFVLGNRADVTQAGGVAIGSNSVANTAAGAVGYTPTAVTLAADKVAITATQSTLAAVSVGAAGSTRQIINVAAGTVDTDAVNVSQLKSLSNALVAGQTHYYSVNDAGTPTGNYKNDGATGQSALAAGTNAIAVGRADVSIGNGAGAGGLAANFQNVAIGENAGSKITGSSNQFIGANTGIAVKGANNSALGSDAAVNVTGDNNSAIGNNAGRDVVGSDNSAMGQSAGRSVTGNFNDAVGTGAGFVVKGSGNLALGSLSGASVAGDFNTASGAFAGDYVSGNKNVSTGFLAGAATRGDSNIASGTTAGIGITGSNNFSAGTGAATGYSLDASGNIVDRNGVTYAAPPLPTIALNDVVAIGTKAITDADRAIAIGKDSLASKVDAIAIGTGAQSTGVEAIAIGKNALATGSVGIGTGSKAGGGGAAFGDFADAGGTPLSVATAVTKGTALGNSAVNQVNDGVALGSGSVASVAGGALGYNPANASATDKAAILATNSTTLGAVSVGTGAAGGNRQIVNVAAGTNASDAVNVAQLVAAQNAATTHYYSVNDGGVIQNNYNNDGATGLDSMAAGAGASASGTRDVMIGYNAGVGSAATNLSNTGVGQSASKNVTGDGNAAFGYGAGSIVAGSNNTALGALSGASVTGGSNIATGFGTGRFVTGDFNISSGHDAGSFVVGTGNIASGTEAGMNISASNTVAIGTSATASKDDAIALGNGATASGASSISIGKGNIVSGNNSGAFGDPNTISGNNAYAFGNNNTITQDNSFVLGNGVVTTQANSVVLGNFSTDRAPSTGATAQTIAVNGVTKTYAGLANAANGVVSVGGVGTERQIINVAAGDVTATSTDAINGSQLAAVASGLTHYYSVNDGGVIQNNYNNDGATGKNSLAAGVNAMAAAENSIVIGNGASLLGGGSIGAVAIGNAAAAGGALGSARSLVAFDGTTQAVPLGSVAIGDNAKVLNSSSVVVGSGASSDRGSAVIIGVGAYGGTLARGGTAIGALAQTGNYGAVALGGSEHSYDNAAASTGLRSIAIGSGDDIAAGSSVAGSRATEEDTIALGAQSVASVGAAIAIGMGATATASVGDVAIGSGSVTAAANATPTGVVNGATYTYAGGAPTSVVSVGTAGKERQITNVAAGQITAASTDAINGSQLFATNQAISAAQTHYYSVNDGGVIQNNYNNDGATGLDSMAAGAGASASGTRDVMIGYNAGVGSAATNLSNTGVGQSASKNVTGDGNAAFGYGAGSIVAGSNNTALGALSGSSVTGGSNIATGFGTGRFVTGDFNISSGHDAGSFVVGTGNIASGTEAGMNISASNTVAIGTSATASKDDAVALGTNAQASGVEAIAIGKNALATGSVGLGSGSKAGGGGAAFGDFADAGGTPLSVATAVTKGTAVGNSAVNQVNDGVALGSGSVASVAGGALGYNPTAASAGDIAAIQATNSTTLGAVSVGTGAAGGNRQIVNVAAGTNDADAVNVAQLKAVDATANKGWNINTAQTGTGVANTPVSTNVAPGDTATFTAGNNIITTQNGKEVQVAVNPVLTGITSLAITNGPTLSSTGINMGGTSITNLAAGVNPTDGVNVSQLTTAIGSTNLVFDGNSGGPVTRTNGQTLVIKGLASTTGAFSGGNVQTVTDPATGKIDIQIADAPKFGNVTINAGGTGIISGVSPGVAGTDAVNVDQLTTVSNVANKGWNVTTGSTGTGVANNQTIANVAPGDTAMFTAGNNIITTQNGKEVQVAVNPVLTGITSLAITNGPTLSSTGINMGGTSITNLAAGVNPTDAVNVSQLTTAIGTVAFNFTGNTGGLVTRTTGQTLAINGVGSSGGTYSGANLKTVADPATGAINIQMTDAPVFTSVTTGNTTINTAGLTIVGGPSVTNIGINAGNTVITNVAPGVNGTDAVNVNQLTTVSTVANRGWDLATGSVGSGSAINQSLETVTPGEQVTYQAGDNLVVTQSGQTLAYSLNPVLTGLTSVSITGGPTIDNTGIHNLAAGVNPTDGVNLSQLTMGLATVNLNFTGNTGGTVNRANGQTLAINGVGSSGGTYSGANLKTVADPATGTINIQMTDAPVFTSVTTGNTTINNAGLTIVGGPSVTNMGINAGNTVITNVAPGVNGTDGVNVNQLTTVAAVANRGFDLTTGATGSGVAVGTSLETISPGEKVTYQAGNNLIVTQTGNTVNYALNPVVTGLTSVSITGGPTIDNTGIHNLAAGVNPTDAVNVSQLTSAIGSVAISFSGNSGGLVTRNNGQTLAIQGAATTAGTYSGGNVKTVTDPATGAVNIQIADAPKFGTVTINDGGTGKITGVAPGTISAASMDAVNGSQLFALGTSIATGLGGGSVYNTTTGAVTTSLSVGGNTYTTVQDALQAVNTTANAGFNVTTKAVGTGTVSGSSVQNIAPGATATFTAGNNIAITQNGAEVQVAVNPNLKVDSVTINGGPVINNAGITLSAGDTLNMGGNTITNLAAGVNGTDGVNVSQLNAGLSNVLNTANTYTDNRINALSFDLSKFKKDANAGTAAAMAMAAVPQAFEPGMGIVGGGVSTWMGQQAIAVGFSKASDNGRVIIKATGTINSRGKGGAAAGVGFQF